MIRFEEEVWLRQKALFAKDKLMRGLSPYRREFNVKFLREILARIEKKMPTT